MKKQYTAPSMKAFNVKIENIMAASGGVGNGGTLGNAYNSGDESYAKGGGDDWD